MRVLLVCSLVVACSAPREHVTASADDAGRAIDERGCFPPDDGPPPDALCVRSVRARVVDETGASVAGMSVTACGDGCSYGETGADGSVRIDARRYMRRPSFLLHGRSRWASYYVRFDEGGDVELGTLVAHRMPSSSTSLKPGVVRSGDVTLTIAHDAAIEIDVIELAEPHEQTFAAQRVPFESAPPWARVEGMVALYALNPFATNLEPGATVRIANTTGLPAGARVELWVHGASIRDRFGPFGGFGKLADASVISDGTAIETDAATPIPHLTWIGVRAL